MKFQAAFLILALAITGCAPEYTSSRTGTDDNPGLGEPGPGDDRADNNNVPDDPVVVPDPGSDALHFETCGATQAWWKEHDDWFVDEGFLGISPNAGLIVRSSTNGGGSAFRLRDGEPLFHVHQQLASGAMASDWAVHGEIVWEGQETRLAIKQLVTGTVVQSVALGERRIPRFVLNEDTSAALIAACDEEALTVQNWSLETGTLGSLIRIEGGCDQFSWYPTLPLSVSADGTSAVVGGRARGELIHVDIESEEWTSVEAHRALEENLGTPYGGITLSAEIRPDGAQAATSGVDGVVRIWNLPEMELVREFTSRAVVLNLDSYQPTSGSAVSWSPDGRLIAHLDADANVVVRKTSDWEILHTIERPVPDDPQSFGGEDFIENAPVQMVFGEDMKSLVVSFDRGVALWRCDAEWAQGSGPLRVELDAPETARVGQPVALVATHFGEANLHGHTFLVNGEPLGLGTTARELRWTPQSPGNHEITVLVADGLSEGSASVTVDVD